MARNKIINMTLNQRSIARAIKDLEDYKESLLYKVELVVQRLAQLGMITATKVIQTEGNGDSDRNITFVPFTVRRNGDVVEGQIIAQGEDILFWEFGAGIYYNNGNAHPKASELGYGVGTYPDQTHAINPGYWWYKGDDEQPHFSLGTEATMPMYKAWLQMQEDVVSVVKEVFRNG